MVRDTDVVRVLGRGFLDGDDKDVVGSDIDGLGIDLSVAIFRLNHPEGGKATVEPLKGSSNDDGRLAAVTEKPCIPTERGVVWIGLDVRNLNGRRVTVPSGGWEKVGLLENLLNGEVVGSSDAGTGGNGCRALNVACSAMAGSAGYVGVGTNDVGTKAIAVDVDDGAVFSNNGVVRDLVSAMAGGQVGLRESWRAGG